MSQDQRVSELEEKLEPEIKRECIFCHDRKANNLWHFTEVTDPFIKEFFAREYDTIKCEHDTMAEPTIWLADQLASSLLKYVIANHIERQTDVPFLDKTLRDKSIMIPAFEKQHADNVKQFPLTVFDEYTRRLIKEKRDCYPAFLEEVKAMYGHKT